MAKTEYRVFISYRRSVSAFMARAIQLALSHAGYDVFLDVESLDNGMFERVILQQIASRPHFLLILSPGTVERCQDPADWLRREIETAIDLKRNVVPVLINGFLFTDARPYLTGKLEELDKFNGVNLYHDYFDAGMEKLKDRFLKHNVARIQVIPPQEDLTVQKRQRELLESRPPSETELSAEYFFDQGVSAYHKRYYQRAVEYFTEAIKVNDRYRQAYWRRGEVFFFDQEVGRAIADWNHALALDPPDYEASRIRSAILLASGNYYAAQEAANQAIVANPNYADGYFARALALHRQSRFKEAVADYSKALELRCSDIAWAYANRGAARNEMGDVTGALRDYTDAINYNINFAMAYNNRGNLYYRLRQYDRAIQDFSRAIQINPNQPISFNCRGNAYRRLDNLDEAMANYNAALRLQPNYDNAYNNRGLARRRRGDLQGAIADYSRAIELAPNDYDAYYNRAVAYQEMRDFANAIKDYERYLGLGGGEMDGDRAQIEEHIRALQSLIQPR